VSRSVTTVDVVVAERGASQLRGEEVHFVARLRAREDADGVGAGDGEVPLESFGGAIERFVPRGLAQDTVVPDERMGPWIW